MAGARPGQIRVGGGRRRPGMVFFGVFVLPFAMWATYNTWDQPLHPEAQALLAFQPEKIPDAENLFLALLAFPISGDEPAHERGAAALAAAAKLPVPQVDGPAPTYAQVLDRMNARVDDLGLQLCSGGNREGAYGCLRNSRAQRAGFTPLLQHVAALLQRYHALEAYPRYADPRPISQDFAPDGTALRVALINLSVIALAMDEGSVEQGIEALSRSAAVWRRVLGARDVGLIDKMTASRAYAAHVLFVSELIRDRPAVLQGPGTPLLEAILKPLSDDERSLAGPLAGEFRAQARVWSQIADPSSTVVRKDFPDTSSWWYRLLTKKNDSINRSYEDYAGLLAIEQGGCTRVRTEMAARQARPAEMGSSMRWYEWFYNPIGRVLHGSIGGPGPFLEYLGRQCNLVALQGMVGLQAEATRSGMRPDAVSNRFRDPNSGTAYRYDADAQTLAFDVIGGETSFLSPLPLFAPTR